MPRPFQITYDANDPEGLAGFWAEALGYDLQPPPEGFDSWEAFADSVGMAEEDRGKYAALIDPTGTGPRVLFQQVPEAKSAKNRVHLDVAVSARDATVENQRAAIEAEVARLVAIGATRLDDHEEHGVTWTVMQDPEGNEFCLS